MPPVRNRAARNWPPYVAVGVSAILVFIVLPNPFRIPQNNPTASAEYAPVPGNQESSNEGNFSETNQATSAGIGAGGEGEGILPGFQPPPLLPQFRPKQKDCIGNPPRQTEDPLSPPCVPFFEGNNGGETFNGVTKDDIKIVFYNDNDVDGDMNAPWKPSDEQTCPQGQYECEHFVRTVKAQLRYFQRRYQTYGRTVKLIAIKSAGGLTSTCAQRQADAATTMAAEDPFAIVFFGGEGQCYNEAMAKREVPSFGLQFDVQRKSYENFRPYVWGFFPDQETEAEYSASFICRKLVGNKARFAGDAALRDRNRSFGMIMPENSQRGPSTEQLANLLIKGVKARCGLTMDVRRYDASGAGAGGREAPGIMSSFKQNNITTVICYCIPVQTEVTVSTMQNTANGLSYHPEWYWDHASAMDRPIWQQTFSSSQQPGLGVSYLWRAPAFREQYHYQAYLQEEPGTQPNVRFNFSLYHLFLNLFQAIQAAGPNLTPDTVERGMFTFNFLDRADPFLPVGGYGPYNSSAVADYNFVDTAMSWWWDPTGTPPGGRRGEGCIRVSREGLRFYAEDWPRGDGDLRRAGDPCTQDTRKLADPSTSGGV